MTTAHAKHDILYPEHLLNQGIPFEAPVGYGVPVISAQLQLPGVGI